jgi:16S rRNA (cytosine1402-N4)-methyltransferase
VVANKHEPVLLQEALDGLAVQRNGCYVDGTYGRGGHSAEILECLGPLGCLLALDKDPAAVAAGRSRFGADSRFTIEHAGFEGLRNVLNTILGERRPDGILLDLGVSSPQLDDPERGFSFSRDGPLDMRMNTETGQTAADWLATVDQNELRQVLYRYGEEPQASRIAQAIVAARQAGAIRSTAELADVVAGNAARSKRGIHPATRVFQAIRIAVNDELAALEKGLSDAVDLLAAGGRLVVISFHSLEDRLVKRFIARESRGDPAYAGLPEMPPAARPRLRRIGRLLRPAELELERNPRARSARMRIAERLAWRLD